MERLFLGIDQGSSSTKGVLLDAHGQHYNEFSVPVSVRAEGDIVEQSPTELLTSVRFVADEAIRLSHRLKRSLAAIGLSCQRSGVCAWHSQSGEVLHPLISHRDTRTRERLGLVVDSHATITERSGLPVTPHYAAGKIALLQEKFPEQETSVATLDSYLAQQLTGDTRFATEDTMAARSMLYNLESGGWDSELCELFGVNESRLPVIAPSLGQHGTYRGVPLTAMLGDQQAGLLGRLAEGMEVVLNLGTISSICICTGNAVVRHPGFVSSVLYSEGEGQREFKYLIEGVTNCSGAILELLLNKMKVCSEIAGLEDLCNRAGSDFATAFFSMGSTGTPDWRSALPNVVIDWDRINQAVFTRALLENIGNFVASNVRLLRDYKLLPANGQPIAVSGGLSDLDYLMQYIADISGSELVRLGSREASARGAAIASLMYVNRGKGRLALPRDRERMLFAPRQSEARQRFERWSELRRKVFSGVFEPSSVFEAA